MLDIKFKEINDNSIQYIGNTDENPEKFGTTMKNLCEENDVSIYWELKKSGEFFISLDFCPAKICFGKLSD